MVRKKKEKWKEDFWGVKTRISKSMFDDKGMLIPAKDRVLVKGTNYVKDWDKWKKRYNSPESKLKLAKKKGFRFRPNVQKVVITEYREPNKVKLGRVKKGQRRWIIDLFKGEKHLERVEFDTAKEEKAEYDFFLYLYEVGGDKYFIDNQTGDFNYTNVCFLEGE